MKTKSSPPSACQKFSLRKTVNRLVATTQGVPNRNSNHHCDLQSSWKEITYGWVTSGNTSHANQSCREKVYERVMSKRLSKKDVPFNELRGSITMPKLIFCTWFRKMVTPVSSFSTSVANAMSVLNWKRVSVWRRVIIVKLVMDGDEYRHCWCSAMAVMVSSLIQRRKHWDLSYDWASECADAYTPEEDTCDWGHAFMVLGQELTTNVQYKPAVQ